MSYGKRIIGVIEKAGCQVPQKFEGAQEVEDVVHACDAGLCSLVPRDEAVHHLIDPNGSCGVVLTPLGCDENTAALNKRREGVRKPPYRSTPLNFSRFR